MARIWPALLVVLAYSISSATCSQPQVSSSSPLLGREATVAHLVAAKQNPWATFQDWVSRHARPYAADTLELARRFTIWVENLEWALEYNAARAGKATHWVGLNSLADLTQEEYRQRFLGYDNEARKALRAQNGLGATKSFRYENVPLEQLPREIDWREQNAVTEVKNQGQCGSCWAFSTTGSVEGINAIFTKELISLSEQELVDCDTDQDKGCRGGLMDNAYNYIIENKGLDTERDYPYVAADQQCSERHRKHRVVTIDGYEDVPENDEGSLRKAVAHQPVSVAIEADQKAFQLYVGGVFSDDSCGTELDHGVLVVGYGVDSTTGMNYWVVKNSWGGDWGEKGYIRLHAQVQSKEGLCGIAMAASYPTKSSANPPHPGPEPGPDPSPTPGPKPGPQPVQCDEASECPASTTCCCVTEFLNLCLQWGCCPMEKATCCEDKQHCCPSNLPVCDTKAGHCMPAPGMFGTPQPWLTKIPATRNFQPLVDRLFPWSHSHSNSGHTSTAEGVTSARMISRKDVGRKQKARDVAATA